MPSIASVLLPITLTAGFAGAVCVYLFQKELPLMFLIHVLGMSGAFLAAGPIGVFIKKVPGNTLVHGTCMFIALLLAAAGYFGIYTHKNNIGRPHVVTVGMDPLQNAPSASWHAWAGAATMALWISTVVVGGMFLHPDYGCLKQNGTVRFVHRNSGAVVILLSLFACALGWNAMHGSAPNMQYAFWAAATLVGLLVVFFRPQRKKRS
eukprot:INCI647.6.p1 GENE.INCI647.6~~INCI647.6.p1  ORF type:complete len:242 (-),score=35.51 INCI647.6:683-1303(-)